MMIKPIYLSLFVLLLTNDLLAGDVKQVRNSDGVVEFTNADVDVRKPTSINRNKTIIYKSLSNDGESFSFSDQNRLMATLKYWLMNVMPAIRHQTLIGTPLA